VRKIAGIPEDVWNRDMRAAAVTEAREAGAANADVAKSSVIRSARPRRSTTAPGSLRHAAPPGPATPYRDREGNEE
jgi:hypothetical protein